MNLKLIAWFIGGILAAVVLYAALNWGETCLSYSLTQDYPDFLMEFPAETLDARLEPFLERQITEGDMEILWKLLWMKKEFHPDLYITNGWRNLLIGRVAGVQSSSLQSAYYQFNILKYKLGINNSGELRNLNPVAAELLNENACKNIELFAQEVDLDDSCSVSHLIEAKFFCGIELAEQDRMAAEKVISEKLGDCVGHCSEHCFEDVPVYVNDCNLAANDNEKYHCLFFTA